MKAVLEFDPDGCDYGPATPAIRRILVEWTEIDWFVASGASDAELARLFAEHNALAHRRAPQVFAERVEIRCVQGGWPEFMAWCTRVRDQKWDWRFAGLKKLSSEHAKARGWSFEAEAPRLQPGQPRPGALFVRIDRDNGTPMVLWNSFLPRISGLKTISHPPATESAEFYTGHAQIDAFNAIQWQLANASDDMTGNPFVPLIRCYRAGAYPFSLDRDTAVLFRFHADERLLPKATLRPAR